MKNESKHKMPKLPLCVRDEDSTMDTFLQIADSDGFLIAKMPGLKDERKQAIAEFITLAVNCHNEVIEALQTAENFLTTVGEMPENEAWKYSLKTVRAALAKATTHPDESRKLAAKIPMTGGS